MATIDGFDELLEQYHLALGAFAKGNPEPTKKLMSPREDVSIANPYDPPVRGWERIAQTIEYASSQRRDGKMTFEIVSSA